MGASLSNCVEERFCGFEEAAVENVSRPSSGNLEENESHGHVIVRSIVTAKQEDDQIDCEFESKLVPPKAIHTSIELEEKLQPPSITIDSSALHSERMTTTSNSPNSSYESVLTAVSPTKDLNLSSKKSLCRSPLPPMTPLSSRNPWSPLLSGGKTDTTPFYLTPIKVQKSKKELSLKIPSSNQKELSPEDIQNAILFNDLQTLELCPKKDVLFTQFRFQEFRGKLALHLAVLSDRVEMVQFILSFHPDISVQDQDGETALTLATRIGNPEIIHSLLSYHSHEEISPLSPFPGNSSVMTASYQESCEDQLHIHVDRRLTDLSMKQGNQNHNSSLATPQKTLSDWTEQESQSISILSGKKRAPVYKRLIPKKMRHVAKQIVHFMGKGHSTEYKQL